MTDPIVVLITAGSVEEAQKISGRILDERAAACVNILPGLISCYRWKGKIENDREVLMLVKSSRALLDDIIEIVKKNHSYEVPEIIALPVSGGSPDYLDWIEEETSRDKS